jgi:hypothetical protein
MDIPNKIPLTTLLAFKSRFSRGVPARIMLTGENTPKLNSECAICFCVLNYTHFKQMDSEQMGFLKRMAQAGFKIPWTDVFLTGQLDELYANQKNKIPIIVFDGSGNYMTSDGILYTFAVPELMSDMKKKKDFWSKAKDLFVLRGS